MEPPGAQQSQDAVPDEAGPVPLGTSHVVIRCALPWEDALDFNSAHMPVRPTVAGAPLLWGVRLCYVGWTRLILSVVLNSGGGGVLQNRIWESEGDWFEACVYSIRLCV